MTTAAKPPKIEHLSGAYKLPTNGKHRPWWRTGLETAALIAVGLCGLELLLSACGVGQEEILQPDPVMGTRHIPNKQVVWRMEGFSNESFNSEGLRDVEHPIAKPAGTFRIALLGDSATEGLQVPLKETYSSVLESIVTMPGKKTEVLNFGCSSYSTGQEVLQFEREVAQYQPDLTVLLYNRGDTLENVRKPTDLKTEPRPYFYIDADGTLQVDEAVLKANQKALQPNSTMDALRKHSRLYGVFSHANLNLSINDAAYRKVRGWMTSPFKARHTQTSTALYKVQDAWQVTSSLLSRLNEDCRKSGSKLVIVTFPNIVQDPEFGRQIESVQKLAETEGFNVFDLTPTFHWYPDPKALFVKYHFSGPGHKVVADKIAEYLKPLLTAK